MIYHIKVNKWVDEEYLISATNKKELKYRLEDMFQCIEAIEVKDLEWKLRGFSTEDIESGEFCFYENEILEITLYEMNMESLEAMFVKGREIF